ncbi:MAG TPA: FkbM family methyltransferase [Thermoanaerobaculia bacterium]
MTILSFLKRLDSARRNRRHRPEMEAFQQAVARLTQDDIAIDCGANVGKFTTLMAETGATVYAFEPHPEACETLVRNTRQYPNVTVFNAAVTAEAGEVRLYLHKKSKQDPLTWSTSSSLLSNKSNVDAKNYVSVEGVPLSKFVRDLGRPVALLKMDIEGAEVDVLNQLLNDGMHESIGQAFVEVHDRRVPELAGPTKKLRERLAAMGVTTFRLDWR